jgi:lysophospholipase L1-like esterase
MSCHRLLILLAWCSLALSGADLPPIAYAHQPYQERKMDPQLTGWPLTVEEKDFVAKAEFARRPGAEINQHLPHVWPVVPAAGFWGDPTSWLGAHEALVKKVQANAGLCDVLLVGDSITIQWEQGMDGSNCWKREFPALKGVNIGIGGDKSQNALWRMDHGGVDGLQPRVCLLMIGNNNMFFAPETGIEAAAQGVKACADNLRARFPAAPLIVAKILPCHAPAVEFYENIRKTNAALDALQLADQPQIHVLDLWADFTNADGTLQAELFTNDHIHLNAAGYTVYAKRLRPLLERLLASAPNTTAGK